MSPPINIDGSAVTDITIDGTSVSEVTVGGDTVFSSVPSNTVSQYNALDGFSASDEGTSVSSWPDEQGNHSISTNGGDALVTGSGINGNRSLDVRGDSVEFQTTAPSVTQPFSVIAVVEYTPTDTSTFAVAYDNGDAGGGSTRTQIAQGVGSSQPGDNILNAGSRLKVSNTETNAVILSARFDGANSLGRAAVDGATSVTETTVDAGTQDANGWTLGSADGVGFYEGFLGAFLIVDAGLSSSEFAAEERRLAGEFGFSGGWT